MVRVILTDYTTEYLINHFFTKLFSYCYDVKFESLKEKRHYTFALNGNDIISIDAIMDKRNFYLDYWIVDFIFSDQSSDNADKIAWIFNVLSGLKIIKICGDKL